MHRHLTLSQAMVVVVSLVLLTWTRMAGAETVDVALPEVQERLVKSLVGRYATEWTSPHAEEMGRQVTAHLAARGVNLTPDQLDAICRSIEIRNIGFLPEGDLGDEKVFRLIKLHLSDRIADYVNDKADAEQAARIASQLNEKLQEWEDKLIALRPDAADHIRSKMGAMRMLAEVEHGHVLLPTLKRPVNDDVLAAADKRLEAALPQFKADASQRPDVLRHVMDALSPVREASQRPSEPSAELSAIRKEISEAAKSGSGPSRERDEDN